MERRKNVDFINKPETTHHTIDFYLNLDFLSQLKIIKIIKRDEIDIYFQSNVSDNTLDILMNNLNFTKNEFIVNK